MNSLHSIIESTLVPHTAFMEASRRIEQCFTYADSSSEPICIALIGESRTGKTRLLEDFRYRNQAQRTAEGIHSPILYIKVPSKPTVKSLAELMLRALGDPMAEKGTENTKTARLLVLIRETGVRLVVLDEFQHFYDKASHQVMHHVADWLKVLVDDATVALVVAGLPTCLSVLGQNEQLAGRFLAPVMMPRFEWTNAHHRNEFIAILHAFHSALSKEFDIPKFYDPELAFRFYCGTGGLMGYLTKFLRQMVWNALATDRRTIGMHEMYTAHMESIWNSLPTIPNEKPFSTEFSGIVTEQLLAQARSIGNPVPPPAKPRGRRASAHSVPSVRSVLSAT